MGVNTWLIHEACEGMLWTLDGLINDCWAATPDDLLYHEKRWAADLLETDVVPHIRQIAHATNDSEPPTEPLHEVHRTIIGGASHLNDLHQRLTRVDLCQGSGFDAYRERLHKVTQRQESVTDWLGQSLQMIVQILDQVLQIINLLQVIEWSMDAIEAAVALAAETAGVTLGGLVAGAGEAAGSAIGVTFARQTMRELVEKFLMNMLTNRQTLGRIMGTIGGVVIGIEAVNQRHAGWSFQTVEEVAFDGMMGEQVGGNLAAGDPRTLLKMGAFMVGGAGIAVAFGHAPEGGWAGVEEELGFAALGSAGGGPESPTKMPLDSDPPIDDVPPDGTGKVAQLGESFGKQGILAENPGIKVDWPNVTDHAEQRLEQRGVTQAEVNSWIENGKALEQSGGSKWLFVTPQGAAVVTNDGILVTVIPASFYDATMLNTVERLFGTQ